MAHLHNFLDPKPGRVHGDAWLGIAEMVFLKRLPMLQTDGIEVENSVLSPTLPYFLRA